MSALRLPVWYCPDCRHQLVRDQFVVTGADELVCVFCARRRPVGSVMALTPEAAGFIGDTVPVLDPDKAVALLVRLGAKSVENTPALTSCGCASIRQQLGLKTPREGA